MGCASYLSRKRVIPENQYPLTRRQTHIEAPSVPGMWKSLKEREEHAPEGAEKVLCVRMHIAMRHNLVLEHPQLFLAGQGAVYEQVRRLEVRRVQRKLLDRVAAVSQNARLAIDERDLALYDGSIEKAFVGHAEALGRLVLYTFPRPQRCGNRLEGRC
jgi:hypothetical protein